VLTADLTTKNDDKVRRQKFASAFALIRKRFGEFCTCPARLQYNSFSLAVGCSDYRRATFASPG